jgi:hypothetical protein
MSTTLITHMQTNQSLLKKYQQQFKNYFNLNLLDYIDLISGFDIVGFDEKIHPPDGASLQEHLIENYGADAERMIFSLIDGEDTE